MARPHALSNHLPMDTFGCREQCRHEHCWTSISLDLFSVLLGTTRHGSAGSHGSSVFNFIKKGTWSGVHRVRKESEGDHVAGLNSRINLLSLFLLLWHRPLVTFAALQLKATLLPTGVHSGVVSYLLTSGGLRSGHAEPTGQRWPAEDIHSRGCTGKA